MQARVAVVDDEQDLREAVVEYLTGMGLRCYPAANAAALKELVAQEAIDVVVLDIAMPGESGLAVGRWLREAVPGIGIIFATGSGSQIDRIAGLEVGADDYVVKPYELRELLARIRSVVRRLPEEVAKVRPVAPAPSRRVSVGGFVLDLDTSILSDATGQTVDLTKMEGDLLAALVARPGRVLSRAQLLELAHGKDGSDENERSIDIRVTRLRKKLDRDPSRPSLIRTVRGDGYVYEP